MAEEIKESVWSIQWSTSNIISEVKNKMVKKSLKDLDLGIIELKKTHQKEDEDLKRKYNDPKEAFEILSK